MMPETLTDPRQRKIVDVFRAFPAGNIYTIAPRSYVERGFAYYHLNHVLGFEWAGDFSVLTAKVRGTRTYSVKFSLAKPGIEPSCNCSAWSASTQCKHVVCALMTVKNLLQPGIFTPSKRTSLQEKRLLESFWKSNHNGPPGIEGYAIVLQNTNFGIDLSIELDGERLNPIFSRMPPALLKIVGTPSQAGRVSELVGFLKKQNKKYPVIFRSGDEELQIAFDEKRRYECKTEFDVRDHAIHLSRTCLFQGSEVKDPVQLGSLVIHREAKSMGRQVNARGWDVWNTFRSAETRVRASSRDDDIVSSNENTFAIPVKRFQGYRYSYPRSLKEELYSQTVLRIEGREAAATTGEIAHRLTILSPDRADDVYLLQAECRLHSLVMAPSYRVFKFFHVLRYNASAPLRAKKRQMALLPAFFDLLETKTKTAAEKVVTEALADGDFKKNADRREGRSLLVEHHAAFLIEEEILQYAEGRWVTAVLNRHKEYLLFRIPFDIFGRQIFTKGGEYDEMIVDAGELNQALPLLCQRLAEQGIALFFKGKPVTVPQWEFLIDATRKQGIDWFEVRPEISCNGASIDASLLSNVLKGTNVIEKKDVIQVLDSNARAILGRIAAITEGSREKGREREIVRVPRLRMLDWHALRNSGVTIKLTPEDEEILEQLSRFERIQKKVLPKGLNAELRPYQREGYSWLAFLYEHRFGACLADDMGLGKTIQAITLLAGIAEGNVKQAAVKSGPHLIVVPPSLLFNWEHEIEKFYPGLRVHLYSGNERSSCFDGHDVVLTTYGTVRRDIELLEKMQFHVIIFDEAQAVKNIYADTTGAVRRLKGCFKLTMTGTPLENHVGEYYSVIDLALPGLLGDYETFRPLIKAEKSPQLDHLLHRTKPFVLRRTKEAVLEDLPPKTETDIYLELTEQQKALYQKTVEQVRSTIDDAYRTKTQAQAKIIALTAILKLRQICIAPQLLSRDLSGVSPKMDFLIEQLQELMDEQHSTLVFSQFTSFLDILGRELEQKKIPYLRLDGSTPIGKRKLLVKQFQSGEGPGVFLLSLKAGGQGLNLTRASYVFHLDPWWNPAVENQASDRAHRIGQQSKVMITRLLMQHTIEEKMMELKKRKQALYQAIMEDTGGSKRGLSVTKTDFQFLLE